VILTGSWIDYIKGLFPWAPKNLPRFDLLSGEDIQDYVSANLAMLSKQTKRSLIDAGWFDSWATDLYSITSNGVLIARTNASGQLTDANGSATATAVSLAQGYLNQYGRANGSPTVNAGASTEAGGAAAHRKIGFMDITLDGAGDFAAAAITPGGLAVGAYYPVIRLLGFIPTGTDAAVVFGFSVTGGALVGPAAITKAAVENTFTQFAGDAGLHLWDITDASQLNIAITSTMNNAHVYLIYEYWCET